MPNLQNSEVIDMGCDLDFGIFLKLPSDINVEPGSKITDLEAEDLRSTIDAITY